VIDTLYRYWCEIVNDYAGWILVGGTVIILGSYFLFCEFKGHRLRRARFMDRPILDEETWFATYYPIEPAGREHARFALNALAEDIGIHWTQLRPSDTFEEMLRVDRRYDYCEDLEHAAFYFEELIENWDEIPRSFPGFNGPLLVFLNSWVDVALHKDTPFAQPLVSPGV